MSETTKRAVEEFLHVAPDEGSRDGSFFSCVDSIIAPTVKFRLYVRRVRAVKCIFVCAQQSFTARMTIWIEEVRPATASNFIRTTKRARSMLGDKP